ncbi:MAG: alcohol dehydrogenase [Deltaproteobacteria bacterium HGW-Deltaproteobacteria-15]|jgi:hydroxyacid-oxoacid transhydrogenase|nr:MAG: alcohol dehydrogenase [Deltaproteobacteria bacterium HGW-Deltaproteobacteria-15]
MKKETVLTMSSASIKYGFGATREVGHDMKELGAKRVMVVTDENVAREEPVAVTVEALKREGIDTVLFSDVRIEPTDGSLWDAVRFAEQGRFDGFVGVGGGSSMDTAKAANLYSTFPADFLEYVNAPIGKGKPVPGPIKPLICVPTTAGTGSETTGVVIFDYEEMQAKTGIAHRHIRPALGVVDPDNTRNLPKMAAACTGFDVLVHALESFTNLPFDQREAPQHYSLRPAYQGSNPISDVWAVKAIEMVSRNIVRVVQDSSDDEARSRMIIAATFAGIGFGNAGLHLPHGMSYPVSGMVRDYVPEGYPAGRPLIPHGMAVVLNAPAAFRFTGPARPDRHLEAARLMGVDVEGARQEEAGEVLARAVIDLMKKTGMPNGLSAVGYTEADIPRLVEGTIPQHRVTKLCPRPFTPEDLKGIFLDSMRIW